MSDPAPSSPPAAKAWAFYDLSLPGRAELLAKDAAEWQALGAEIVVAGRPAAPHVFLDGLQAEDQWLKQDRWRGTLEALRTELASAVDGEVFLRAARRAVWLASRASSSPSVVFGAGLAESLAVWLVGRLLNVPFVATLDDDTRWESKLVSQLKSEARSVRAGTVTAALSSPA